MLRKIALARSDMEPTADDDDAVVSTIAVFSTVVLDIDLTGEDGGVSSADVKGAMMIFYRSRWSSSSRLT